MLWYLLIQVIIHEHRWSVNGSSGFLLDFCTFIDDIVTRDSLLAMYIFSESLESSDEHVLFLKSSKNCKVTILLLHEEKLL